MRRRPSPDRSLPALVRKAMARGSREAAHLAAELRRGLTLQPDRQVSVSYRGRMGNRFFQYSLGRLIAEHLEFPLEAAPIEGFPGTDRGGGPPASRAWGFGIPRERLTHHVVDLPRVLANSTPREILLWGYFERYEYYRAFKETIREWLRCPVRVSAPDPGDVVIHVRSGDIWDQGGPYGPSPIHAAVPVSYYQRILERMSPDRVLLVTENPNDPVAHRLTQVCGARIVGGSPMEDYALMLAAPRIVLSMSTFAWWGAWLSGATEVHMPLWAGWHPDSTLSKTDLRVTDESRYVFHDLGVNDGWRGDAADLERTLEG